MPPCSLVRAASQQPHARYGSKKSEFVYPATAHGTTQVLLLGSISKTSWGQENWLRISGVSFETKSRKGKNIQHKNRF